MRKVKVLKELPGAKVGSEWDGKQDYLTIGEISYCDYDITTMRRTGFIEYVEDKPATLRERMARSPIMNTGAFKSGQANEIIIDTAIQIATEHAIETVERVFAEEVDITTPNNYIIKNIIAALKEGAGNE